MSNPETIVCLPDSHVPFHDKKLYDKVLRCLDDIKPDRLIILGDFLDMYSLSPHNKDSLSKLRDFTLDHEYEEGSKLLDQIEQAVSNPKCKKYFLHGNHENFYYRELSKGDHGKYGSSLRSPIEGLKLKERKFWIGENWKDSRVDLGHLEVIHGIFYPVHCAKKHLDEIQGSVIFGHVHRMQSFISGKRAAYAIGNLVDKNNTKGFGYMSRIEKEKWCQGFAIVRLFKNKSFLVEPIQVFNGRFVANGKLY